MLSINKEIRDHLDWSYLMSTEGVYVVYADNSLIVAHRCDYRNPSQIDLDGEDMYITYLEGDMQLLLTFTDPSLIRYVLFQRNGEGKVRKYPFKRVTRLVDKII